MAVTMNYDKSFSTSAATGGPRINVDYRMQLIKQRESAAPFLSLMLNINNEPTQTHQFKTFETRPNPKKSTTTGTVAEGTVVNTAATWNVADGTYFNVGDIVVDVSADAFTATLAADVTRYGIITAISTNALTVRPNDPAKKIQGITSGDTIAVVGRSNAQGTTSPKPDGTVPSLLTFTTGIMKHSYQVNKTQANNRLYGAPERDRLRGETEIEHLVEIEKQLLFGDGVTDLTNDTDPRTNMTGLINNIATNKFPYGASLTKEYLFQSMTTIHAQKYAADGKMSRRVVLCSADFLYHVNKIALDTKMTPEIVTVYGMDVSKLRWIGRTWDLIEDPVLSDLLPGWAIGFHPRYVRLREFRPTRLEANIQANDADYFKDQFLTELGLETQLEELAFYFRPGT